MPWEIWDILLANSVANAAINESKSSLYLYLGEVVMLKLAVQYPVSGRQFGSSIVGRTTHCGLSIRDLGVLVAPVEC
jgi:hypothetical protein